MAKKPPRRSRRPHQRNTTPRAAREVKPDADAFEFEGVVLEQLRNASFRVDLGSGNVVFAHTAGKMRKFRIRIMPGDRVIVALSPYDTTRGRIVYRHK